jgi:hypothetical protein
MSRSEQRFVYSHHTTLEKAQAALEHYFAAGEVCEGEHPTIERRKYLSIHGARKSNVWFNVEIDG